MKWDASHSLQNWNSFEVEFIRISSVLWRKSYRRRVFAPTLSFAASYLLGDEKDRTNLIPWTERRNLISFAPRLLHEWTPFSSVVFTVIIFGTKYPESLLLIDKRHQKDSATKSMVFLSTLFPFWLLKCSDKPFGSEPMVLPFVASQFRLKISRKHYIGEEDQWFSWNSSQYSRVNLIWFCRQMNDDSPSVSVALAWFFMISLEATNSMIESKYSKREKEHPKWE